MKSFLRRDGVVILIYILLALVLTYPLIAHLDTHVPGRGVDDPALTWNQWWLKFSIFNLGASPLYSDYIYYPLGVNLVADTSTFLNGVLSLPLQFLFGVIVATNLLVYFALVAGGYGTFLLARETLGVARHNIESDIAAAIAGAFYAFGAWHINYVAAGHLMLLSNEWIPFFALYLIRSDKARWKNGALAGLFFALTAWTELTFIPFIATLTVLYVVYVIASGFREAISAMRFGDCFVGTPALPGGAREDRLRATLAPHPFGSAGVASLFVRVHPRPTILNLSTFAIIAIIGVSPLLVSLLADTLRYGYYIAPGQGRVQVFSAEPISFFVPSFTHPLVGALGNALTNANTSYAFVGYAALILAALGFIFQRASRDARFWCAAAIFFALILLGPTLIVAGQNTNVPMPFALVRAIPFVNANRYPVRFNAMLMLALTPLIAFGAARLMQRRRTVILSALVALLALEQLAFPIPLTDLRAGAIFQTIRDEPGDFTVLDLPLGWRDSVAIQGALDYKAQFLQTIHEKRLIGGLVSRHPNFKYQYFLELPVINSLIALENGREIDEARRAQDRARAPTVLRFFDIRYVEAHRALTDARVLEYARDLFSLTEIYRDDERIVYRVAPQILPNKIDLGNETARLYFDDAWGRLQFSAEGLAYRWATRSDSQIWLPLEPRAQTITFRLRGARARQNLVVRVNGRDLATLALSDAWQDYAVSVPADALRASLNEFVFATDTMPVAAIRMDEYAIGDTGVIAPVDIAATGAGFDAGRFGEIFVAGKNVLGSRAERSGVEGRRGYHLAAINPQSGAVERVASFDTFADAVDSARLAQFIADLPRGEIVAGVAVDDVSKNLQPSAVDALRSIGVEGDLRFQFRAGHAFIGVKGAQPGQVAEQTDGRLPANVAVGKNVASDRAAFALSAIQIEEPPR